MKVTYMKFLSKMLLNRIPSQTGTRRQIAFAILPKEGEPYRRGLYGQSVRGPPDQIILAKIQKDKVRFG